MQRQNGGDDDEELSLSALIAQQEALFAARDAAAGIVPADELSSDEDEDYDFAASALDLGAQADQQEQPFRDRFSNVSKEAVDAAWRRARALIMKNEFDLNRDGPVLVKEEENKLAKKAKFLADKELAGKIEAPFRAKFEKDWDQNVVDVALELAKRHVRSTQQLFDVNKLGSQFIEQARHQLRAGIGVASLKGKLDWTKIEKSQSETSFGQWLLDDKLEPDPNSSMNCYEAVLFGAYKLGAATFVGLKKLYQRLDESNDPLEKHIVGGPIETYDLEVPESPRPLPGDVVVFGTAANHTAMAVGNKKGPVQVLSLYNKPNKYTKLQHTTAEALVAEGTKGPVRFFAPRFP